MSSRLADAWRSGGEGSMHVLGQLCAEGDARSVLWEACALGFGQLVLQLSSGEYA